MTQAGDHNVKGTWSKPERKKAVNAKARQKEKSRCNRPARSRGSGNRVVPCQRLAVGFGILNGMWAKFHFDPNDDAA
jgi:hypothetical protein